MVKTLQKFTTKPIILVTTIQKLLKYFFKCFSFKVQKGRILTFLNSINCTLKKYYYKKGHSETPRKLNLIGRRRTLS